MLTRRQILKHTAQAGVAFALPSALWAQVADGEGVEVNDVQSQLNATRVNRIVKPKTVDEIQAALRDAIREGRAISIAGGKHAMGGQQFGHDGVLLDMKQFNRVIGFDAEKGLIEVEAGIQWPELIDYLLREQAGLEKQWGIREKQTGVDHLTIGGSLAANIHGRGLQFPPFIGDIESFGLLDANGNLLTCSRSENRELFSLAIGGYGLFGIVTRVTLRLVQRKKVQRVVELIAVKDLIPRIEERIKDGFLYGDCQYSMDMSGEADFHQGVFSCYKPVSFTTPIPSEQKHLTGKDWAELYTLARTDKKQAFEKYAQYYKSTSGQVYWSDTQQLAGSFEGYRQAVDVNRGTEVITEIYVSKENFLPFMAAARRDFIQHNVDMTYGTIRFIEKDTESFLAWAREPSVCIICNLHVRHTEEGKKQAAANFRRIIDRAIEFKGRYYLTYHRWATRDQVLSCYPQFVEFLKLKKKYDPQERFQSDWYRHYKTMFADLL